MVILLIVFVQLLIQPIAHGSILGKWRAEHMQSTIEISQTGESDWKGVIVESEKKEWIGKTMLDITSFDSNEQIWKGTLIIPSMGMKITSTVQISSDSMVIVGKKMFITKTYTWQKLKNEEPIE
jgi:uncharacterized protein (DUF2147 family)